MKRELAAAFLGVVAAGAVDAAPVGIDCGRQLFVDDYLVGEAKGVVRHWNEPVKAPAPVIRPAGEKKGRTAGATVATNGGLWWDPTISRYRLWYESEWMGYLCYAESRDGLEWEYPDLGKSSKEANRVFPDSEVRLNITVDSWSVWPDYKAANPYGSWKLFMSEAGGTTVDTLFESGDGKTFRKLGVAGYSGDRSTCHFDTILGKWVFSLRDYRTGTGRCRCFHTQDEFKPGEKTYRTGKDAAAKGNVEAEPWVELDAIGYGPREQQYCFDAVPYESLMLGVVEVLHNMPRDNQDPLEAGMPKLTSLRFAFSRDGRKYSAAPAPAIKPSGWGSGKWDTGYLSAMGGICTVGEKELRFYYSGFRGDAEKKAKKFDSGSMHKLGMHMNGAIGYATLRRDGFAGMVADGAGEIVTKGVTFSGRHLFVNAECFTGEVKAEIIGEDGKPYPGYSAEDCTGIEYGDSTKRKFAFKGGDLAKFAGKEVRIRFLLRCATLYSFWVSPSEKGESGGWVAAGGPGYSGLKDK